MPAKAPNPVRRLSPDLRPIYDLEISLGNELHGIAEPAGTECPFAVLLVRPLHLEEISKRLRLPPTVEHWENRDPHYDLHEGYACAQTGHTISGPLTKP